MKYTGGLRLRREHRLVLEQMEWPADRISRPAWRGVMELLFVLASHYPRACPGIDTIAYEAGGVSHRTVQYWIANAQKLGLLEVLPDQGIKSRWGSSKTNLYVIPALDKVSRGAILTSRRGASVASRRGAMLAPKGRSTTYSLPTKDPSGRKTSSSSPTERATSGRTTVSAMNREPGETDAEFRQRIAAAAGAKRLAVRPRQSERSPAQRTASHFATGWVTMVEENPEFRDIRPWESKGMTTGYLNSVFFYPEAGRVYEEDEVRAFIEDFIEAVRTSRVQVKAGQSAFMRFTGWWGRSDWSSVKEDERPFMG